MNLKEKFGRNKGITLIALVVTIIVLLLLAGISINMLTGENGILNRTSDAKNKTKQSSLGEEIKLKLSEATMESNLSIEEVSLKPYLEQVNNVMVEEKSFDMWHVTRGDTSATVYQDGEVVEGKVDFWDGVSIEAPKVETGNWEISTGAELKFFADFVNNGNALTEEEKAKVAEKGYSESDYVIDDNTIVSLISDLDLGARQKDGEKTSGTAWTPIGKTSENKFTGTFKGNNHTIRGIYVKENSNFAGIFGISDTIKDLKIKNSYIETSAGGAGGIVGVSREGSFENCENINTKVIGKYAVGGIVGQFSTGCIEVKDCKNSGNVVATGKNDKGNSSVGGICGILGSNATISYCNNTGNVDGMGKNVGGISGTGGKSSQITYCTNTGNVDGTGIYVGGIMGLVGLSSEISYCANTGNIVGTSVIGGICGASSAKSKINNCSNKGDVTGNGQKIGGILGLMAHDGNGYTYSTTELCYNSGNVKGNLQLGGIVGYVGGAYGPGTVKNCYSKGKISGKTELGAIIGKETDQTNTKNTFENLYYLNTVGIKAITVKSVPIDMEEKNVTSTTDDIASYEEFITWLENKNK